MGDADDVLFDDGACVELCGDVVAGGSDDFHTTFPCLMIGLGADEGGEEGVVDVDDMVGVGLDHLFGDDLHVACKDDEGDAVLFEQFHFLLFLLGLILLVDGENVVGDAKLACHRFEVGMVGDDEGNVAVPFAGGIACEHVEEAVAHLGYEDGHAWLDIGEVEAERHVVLLCVEGGEVVLNLVAGNGEVGEFPLDACEEYVLDVVHVLVEIDDVTAVDGDEVRYLRQYAWSVGAVEQEFCGDSHPLCEKLKVKLKSDAKVQHIIDN